MSINLSNAPTTFKGVYVNFSNMAEDRLELFMDDFSIIGDSIEDRLANLNNKDVKSSILCSTRKIFS